MASKIRGGTAGLTIASRLTANPKISVLVLEAGNDHSNDTNILSPGLYTGVYGNEEYDWNFKTVPQVHVNNQVFAHPRGKQLGGSSAINFLYWTHASRQDIDNWGLLGNANWSWAALDPYFKRSESFISPKSTVEDDLQTQNTDPSIHGHNGPIINTFPDIYGPLDEAWPRTYETLGLLAKSDPRDGLALGGYTNLLNLDLNGRKRSYAATGYYMPVKQRTNLKVLTGALVEKIILEKSKKKGGDVLATGVKYSNGTVANARKEVILCAGSIGSPQILELSGIGSRDVLEKNGIEVLVENDNVGENLQDHVYVPISYEVQPGIATLDNFSDPTYFEAAYEEYLANATGPLATTGASSGLLSCAQIGCADLVPPVFGGMSPQYQNDTTKLFASSSPGNYLTLLGVLEHPYSRGSIHISSPSPLTAPLINPSYLSHPFDLRVLTRILTHLKTIALTPPLSTLLLNPSVPSPYNLPSSPSNSTTYIPLTLQSEYHPLGTCSMLPRARGGVVDAKFRVYGARNLRVIDASVFPLLVRGNLQTLVYAVAERGAEFVEGDWVEG
ncbi:GMC oxidoreductase protein [Rutstroemia sp. NJR-2017a WRK4]|nr:GMC oxidoreductase protein [Rutstroemia sp. NJR-2017a WRK4]